jgi:hypothetical protein
MTIPPEEIEALKAAYENSSSEDERIYDVKLNALMRGVPALISAAEEAASLRAEIARVTAEREDALPWKLFYGDGLSLGEVAAHFGKSIYAFSPWLTAPLVRSIREASEKANAERDAAISQATTARREGIEAAALVIEDEAHGFEMFIPEHVPGTLGYNIMTTSAEHLHKTAATIRALLDAPADASRIINGGE